MNIQFEMSVFHAKMILRYLNEAATPQKVHAILSAAGAVIEYDDVFKTNVNKVEVDTSFATETQKLTEDLAEAVGAVIQDEIMEDTDNGEQESNGNGELDEDVDFGEEEEIESSGSSQMS